MVANTLQGWLVYILRECARLPDTEIFTRVLAVYESLKKPNGEDYPSDSEKALKMVIASSNAVTRDSDGQITLREGTW